MKEKVILAMSGGVDSALAAYLLQEEGYEVLACHFYINEEEATLAEAADAKKMAEDLGLFFVAESVEKEFQEKVIAYYLRELEAGRTPSPCPLCDDIVKFQFLFDMAERYGAKYVATGHYAKISYVEKWQRKLLEQTHEIQKDQCYMLYRLSPEQLERILFPLAKLEKTEVRALAEKLGLHVAKKKDSQGICFAKEGYKAFLEKHLSHCLEPGNFVGEEGEILGQHQGYPLYTIGQRRGLGIRTKEVSFIHKIDPDKNEIHLGRFALLLEEEVLVEDFHLHIPWEEAKELVLIGRPRFSSRGFPGKLEKRGEEYYFHYHEKNAHNAPGQHIVFFSQNYLIGGGSIGCKKKKEN